MAKGDADTVLVLEFHKQIFGKVHLNIPGSHLLRFLSIIKHIFGFFSLITHSLLFLITSLISDLSFLDHTHHVVQVSFTIRLGMIIIQAESNRP